MQENRAKISNPAARDWYALSVAGGKEAAAATILDNRRVASWSPTKFMMRRRARHVRAKSAMVPAAFSGQ